jgi:hypothetical protein
MSLYWRNIESLRLRTEETTVDEFSTCYIFFLSIVLSEYGLE